MIRRLRERLAAAVEAWLLGLSVRRNRLIGLSLLRILLGTAALEFYLSEYRRREVLWGPEGYFDITAFRGNVPLWWTSVYGWTDSSLLFESVYHTGIVAAVAFTVCGGRTLTALHGFLIWSVHLRNGYVLDHGHLLSRILLLFLLLTTCDAYLSPWASRRRARLSDRVKRARWGDAVHNCAVFLMVFQVCVVYCLSGLWKLLRDQWREGTAVYYVVHAFETPPLTLTSPLASTTWITVPLTYATVVLEVAFPVLLATRHPFVRGLTALSAAAMHVGIVPLVGLLNFSLTMIAADCLLLRDADYRASRSALRRLSHGAGRMSPHAGARRHPGLLRR
ncbi:HTTM domain-containing protein [Streptomyces albus]|uniref:HTTM domain-containing protein n=1 Tax=Streptomyces sp. PHES57 TaxID=2872626 RepID=UPI001CEDE0EE|nr:HTTM domain-containing protein [Streptomyces sp. PHES57]